MLRFLGHRFLQLVLVLLLVATGSFALVRVIPGDPIAAGLGMHFSQEVYEARRQAMRLDRPLVEQYVEFLGDTFLRFDLGKSFHTGEPVADDLARRFPATLELTLAAMAIAIVAGIAAGVVSAVYKNSLPDYASMGCALLGVSVPVYFLAIVLIIAFGEYMPYGQRIDPTVRFEGPTGLLLVDTLLAGRTDLFRDVVSRLLLPAFALSTIPMAITARMTRSAMLDVLREDYVRTARAKGVHPLRVVMKHAFRNASLPTVTVIGLNFGYLLAGAILTETLFSWPGMGLFIIQAFGNRDYPSLQAGVLAICVAFVVVNLAVDLLYAVLDPRIRFAKDGVVKDGRRTSFRDASRLLAGVLPATARALRSLPGLLGAMLLESARSLRDLPGGARRFRRSKSALVGLAIVVLFFTLAAVAPWIAPHGANDLPGEGAQPARLFPGLVGDGSIDPDPRTYLLGTDMLGHDIFSRVVHGARVSLTIGAVAVGVSLLAGVPLGLVAGYYGGVLDAAIMRLVDAMLAFPSIILVFALFTIFDPVLRETRINPIYFLMIAVGVVGIPRFCRQVRGSVLQVKGLDYVVAARALGFDDVRILLRIVLPNVLSPILVLATLGMGTAILEAAGFAFLGIGTQPDAAEWGTMLSYARGDFLHYPWIPIAPGLAITLVVLGFNLLGDGLRDVLDPKLR